MKGNSLEKLSIFELSATCEEAVRLYGLANDNGQYKIVNKQHDVLVKLWKELHRRGQEGRTILLHLMKHANPWVRLWAATNVLFFAPDRAEQVLSELATSAPSLARFMAEVTLREWRKGALKLPD